MNKRLKLYAQKAHKVCPDVPLNTHAHLFRHVKASHWLEDGLNVLQVSFLLGHAQLETTMIYLDISTEEKAKAMATLESEKDAAVSTFLYKIACIFGILVRKFGFYFGLDYAGHGDERLQ